MKFADRLVNVCFPLACIFFILSAVAFNDNSPELTDAFGMAGIVFSFLGLSGVLIHAILDRGFWR